MNSGLGHDNEPWDARAYPLHTLRHHWSPQFRPNKAEEPSVHANVALHPEPYKSLDRPSSSTDDQEGARPRESRFFPLSAFISSPSPVVSEPTRQVHRTRKPLVAATSKSTHKAASSAACRALALYDTDTTTKDSPVSAIQKTPSPSPLTGLASQRKPNPSYGIVDTPAPLSITSPQTVSPFLTTTPVVGTPSIVASPLIDLSEFSHPSQDQPPAPPPRAMTVPYPTHACDVDCYLGKGSRCPRSLITAPVTSPYPFVVSRQSSPPSSPLEARSSGWGRPREGLVSPFSSGRTKPDGPLLSLTSSLSVEEFLKMGHANPCWCSHASHNIPLEASRDEVSVVMPVGHSNNAATQMPTKPGTLCKRKREESQATYSIENPGIPQMEPVDSGPSSLWSSSSEPESKCGFENMASSVHESLTPDNEMEDDLWTIVSAGDIRYQKLQNSIPASQDSFSDPEIVSEPEIISMPSSPTPSVPCHIPPFDFELSSSPPVHVPDTAGLSSLPALFEMWPSPPRTPLLTPIRTPALPSTPLPTAMCSPEWAKPLPPAVPPIDTLNAWSIQYQSSVEEEDTANATAFEWPTLQEAVHMNQRRTNMAYTMDDEECTNWNGITDWSS